MYDAYKASYWRLGKYLGVAADEVILQDVMDRSINLSYGNTKQSYEVLYMDYETRIVCYMDLLGFKKMIYESATNSALREKILNTLQNINGLYDHFRDARNFCVVPEDELKNGFRPRKIIDVGLESEMSLFSDSIVFSYKLTQHRKDLMDIMMALHEISMFAFQLLLNGFFVRGGLSYGQVYHNGNVCFGPAMVKAVMLEENATYPRISIDPSFFNEEMIESVYYGNKHIMTRNREFYEEMYHCVDVSEMPDFRRSNIWQVRKDSRFIHYLDILDANINYDKKLALHVKSVIENELSKPYTEHIMKKYVWFKEYYNSVVYNHQCLGEDVCVR